MTDKERNYKILRKTGRLTNGNEGGAGFIYHAVKNGNALCGTKPGRLSDWSFTEVEKITCSKCLKKLEQISIQNAKAVEALEKLKTLIENKHKEYPIVYDITDDVVGGCVDFDKCMKIIDNLIKEYGVNND